MNTRAKTTIIIAATLIIGIVIGALGSGALHRKFIRDSFNKPFRSRMKEFMIDRIGPEPGQRDTLNVILDNHIIRMDSVMKKNREEMKALSDSLKVDLSGVLNEEQMRRYEEDLKRIQRDFPGHRPPGMPPGEKPPPPPGEDSL